MYLLCISLRHGTCLHYSVSFSTTAAGNVLQVFFLPNKMILSTCFTWPSWVGMLLPLPPAVPFREGTAGMTLLFITRFTVWAVPRKCAGTIRHFYSCLCLRCLFFSLCLFLRCFLAVNWSVIFCRQGCLKFAVWPVAFMLNDNLIILVPLENQAWKKQTWLIELAKRKSPCFSYLNCV